MKIDVIKDYRPYMIIMCDEKGYVEEPYYAIGPFKNKSEAVMYLVKHIERGTLVALNNPDDGLPVTYLHKGDNNGNTTVGTDGTGAVSVSVQSTSD